MRHDLTNEKLLNMLVVVSIEQCITHLQEIRRHRGHAPQYV